MKTKHLVTVLVLVVVGIIALPNMAMAQKDIPRMVAPVSLLWWFWR